MSDSEEPKHPGGRPTLYKPEYCQTLIDHMSNGLSYESFAGVVGTAKQTIYDWEKAHPEFLDAKQRAFALSQVFWEQKGIDGLFSTSESDEDGNRSSKSINASVWIFNMKNRFGWRDRQPGEEDTVVVNNISALPDDQLDARLEKLLGKKE